MKDTLLTDETMELIAKLYSYMDEEEMASWSILALMFSLQLCPDR